MIDYQNSTTSGRPQIVIIEPSDVLREGYVNLLSGNKEYRVGPGYPNAERAIRNLQNDAPDLIITELDLPGMGGINAIRKVKKFRDHTRILVITNLEDQASIFAAFAAGASGFITKGSNHWELLRAVVEVLNNGAPLSPAIARRIVASFQRSPNSPLSNRETEILCSLAKGKTYKLTANDLHIGMETVKSHVKNIYTKLRVSTKSEAIDLARKRCLI